MRTTLAAVRERVAAEQGVEEVEPQTALSSCRTCSARWTFRPRPLRGAVRPDGVLVFGNGKPMTGPDEIAAGGGFFTTIASLSHRITRHWH